MLVASRVATAGLKTASSPPARPLPASTPSRTSVGKMKAHAVGQALGRNSGSSSHHIQGPLGMCRRPSLPSSKRASSGRSSNCPVTGPCEVVGRAGRGPQKRPASAKKRRQAAIEGSAKTPQGHAAAHVSDPAVGDALAGAGPPGAVPARAPARGALARTAPRMAAFAKASAVLAGPAAAHEHMLAYGVFSGSWVLAEALTSVGIPCLPLDIKSGGEQHNMALEGSQVRYVHYAPQCNTYSLTQWPIVRSRAFPEGLPHLTGEALAVVALANTMSSNMVRLLRLHCVRGVSWSCENPASSLLWHTADFKRLFSEYNVDKVTVDTCCFGTAYRKRTTIMTWDPQGDGFLRTLNQRCHCTKPHKTLTKGFCTHDSRIPTRDGTAAYPRAMCTSWARAVQNHLRMHLLGL